MGRLTTAAVLLLATLAASSCGSRSTAVSIGEVVADPARYGDQTVELRGQVSGGVGLLSVGMYKLSDATGEIHVLTTDGVPRDGATLIVRGEVLSGVTVGGTQYGVSLREQQREYPE